MVMVGSGFLLNLWIGFGCNEQHLMSLFFIYFIFNLFNII